MWRGPGWNITRELTDITSRFVSLQSSDVTTLLNASAQVMAPYDSTAAKIILSEVQVCTATTAKVRWSQATGNTTARNIGDTITLPSNMTSSTMIPAGGCVAADATGSYGAGANLIFGEVQYTYRPPVSFASFTSMSLQDSTYMSPRVSNSVPLS